MAWTQIFGPHLDQELNLSQEGRKLRMGPDPSLDMGTEAHLSCCAGRGNASVPTSGGLRALVLLESEEAMKGLRIHGVHLV